MRTGYVSAIHSATEFDLNGEHVLCDEKTHFESVFGTGPAATPCAGHLYLGEPLAIVQSSRKHGMLHAELLNTNTPPADMKVSGYGILDLPPAAEVTQANGTLYADGRHLRLTGTTRLHFTAPLTGLQDVHPGTWVAYEAHPQKDGTLTVQDLTFVPNTVTPREAKLLSNFSAHITMPDYPAKKEGSVQFGKSKHVSFHILANQDLQERVQAIGARLIPAWQKALPESDPLRIHFRFFVVTHKPMHNDGLSSPDGTILIPEKIATEITDDQQLAAILASNMAEVLEKQALRYQLAQTAFGVSSLGSIGADFAPIPGLGPGLGLGSYIAESELQRHANQQADRVSLQLLHQAGYDIAQSFIGRNAADHKGDGAATPYSARAVSLLTEVGNWKAAELQDTH